MDESPQSVSLCGEPSSKTAASAWMAALRSTGWLPDENAATDFTPKLSHSPEDFSDCLLEGLADLEKCNRVFGELQTTCEAAG